MAKYQQHVYPWRAYSGDVVTRRRSNGSMSYRAVRPNGVSCGTFDSYNDAADALRKEWMTAAGNPRLVAVQDATGRELQDGDPVTDFRGNDDAVFRYISARGNTGTWKITVRHDHGRGSEREYYASVYGVTVKEIRDTDDQ